MSVVPPGSLRGPHAHDASVLFGVAGVQMQVSAFVSNLERMGNWMRHIRQRFPWVRMVMFSELAPLGPRHEAEPMPGPTEQRLCALARESGLWLIPGSMFERVNALEVWVWF